MKSLLALIQSRWNRFECTSFMKKFGIFTIWLILPFIIAFHFEENELIVFSALFAILILALWIVRGAWRFIFQPPGEDSWRFDGEECPYLLGLGKPIDLIEYESSYEIKIGFPRNNSEKKVKFNKNFIISGLDKENINHQTWFLHTENSFQQTIEYAGKSGSTLKFIYSEFIYGFARDAFTREFTIDTDEGNIGAYKGAVFEVIEATNSSIKFKVIRHFKS